MRSAVSWCATAGPPRPEDYDDLTAVPGAGEVILIPRQSAIEDYLGLNLSRTDRAPRLLAWLMAGLGTVLCLYHVATRVRARQGELAVLRALGFTSGEVSRSALAQATIEVAMAAALGGASGTIVGRLAWRAYAENLDVLPVPVTPWGWLARAATGMLALGVIASVGAARLVSRTRPGTVLRGE